MSTIIIAGPDGKSIETWVSRTALKVRNEEVKP
jgi:hypothetical protein